VFNYADDMFNIGGDNKIMSIATPFSYQNVKIGIILLQYRLEELRKMIEHVSIQ
jgi:hypothetical protein